MFNKEYQFIGKHSIIVKKLASELDTTNKFKLFERYVDVLCIAPIIGLLYNKRSERDNSENARSETAKIFLDQLKKEEDVLNFNYKLVMLLHEKKSLEIKERLNRSFRYNENDPNRQKCNEIYESYILGGIEKLDEKLLEGAVYIDDYIGNMFNFINEYNSKLKDISIDSILELLAKSEY